MHKIMIVDDEESLRELIKALFVPEGYKVIAASSGIECLELLKTEKPDLILMDMMMPEMNGKETIERIRHNPSIKKLKIVMLTVVGLPEIGKKILDKLGVLNYIAKPFDNDNLIKIVKNTIKPIKLKK